MGPSKRFAILFAVIFNENFLFYARGLKLLLFFFSSNMEVECNVKLDPYELLFYFYFLSFKKKGEKVSFI